MSGGSLTVVTTADEMAVDDAELEAEALAAAPVDVVPDDAVCWWDVVAPGDLGLLPPWYMPTAPAGARRLVGWKRTLAWALVLMFLAINAAGLCSTYGRVVPANL